MKFQQNALCTKDISVGLELEYEEVTHIDTHTLLVNAWGNENLWAAKRDGSLRPRDANTELVFCAPLSGSLITEALGQLSAVQELPYNITWRCGMHVHVDHRGSSATVAYRELVLACLLERALFGWAGLARTESKFCAPITDVARHLWNAGIATSDLSRFTPSKYVSVNLVPLRNTGSVEYRFADSTRDVTRMLDYINIGLGMRLLSQSFVSSLELVESVTACDSLTEWLRAHAPPQMCDALCAEDSNPRVDISALEAAIFLAEKEQFVDNRPV